MIRQAPYASVRTLFPKESTIACTNAYCHLLQHLGGASRCPRVSRFSVKILASALAIAHGGPAINIKRRLTTSCISNARLGSHSQQTSVRLRSARSTAFPACYRLQRVQSEKVMNQRPPLIYGCWSWTDQGPLTQEWTSQTAQRIQEHAGECFPASAHDPCLPRMR